MKVFVDTAVIAAGRRLAAVAPNVAAAVPLAWAGPRACCVKDRPATGQKLLWERMGA